jgi:hypothetical protein
MKLSVVMPSHNVGRHVNLNILNACSMGGSEVEVIIRDNSGNPEKRDFLSRIQTTNCRILSVDECPGEENTKRLIDEATGEFVFFIADDDYANSYAIPSILAEIDLIRDDPAIVGTTGIMIVDDTPQTYFVCFDDLNKPDPVDRFQSFLRGYWPSVFQYSPVRLSALRDIWSFSSTLPVYVCYHDLLMNCMLLMHGRLTYRQRFLYQYYNANWSSPEQHLNSEANSFRNAGLDVSAVRVQWLIAAFEGAQTFASKYQRVQLPQEQRQALAFCWFNRWFPELRKVASRQVKGAKFDMQAQQLAGKWQTKKLVSLPELLTDISEYYALTSPEIGQRYYNFWR